MNDSVNRSRNPSKPPNGLKLPPEKLPDRWLFDSEKLLRELARCRELVLNVPINDTQATHFALNIAINAIWDLQQHLRYLLHLHREGQRQFIERFVSDLSTPTTKDN